MPLFKGKKGGRSVLPSDIVRRMELYGQFEFSPQDSAPDVPGKINNLIYQPLYSIATADPDRFISELAAAVLPVGGWAVYGGQRCVRDLIAGGSRHPDYFAMVDAAVAFLRSQGYGQMRLAPVELEAWHELHPGDAWQEGGET